MSNRKGFAAVAACAALACAGLARASDATTPSATDSSALTLSQPIFAADAAPRKPLMALLDKAGAGGTLDQYGINIGGFVEAGWTYNFQTPKDQVNYGRVFDVEDQDLTLNQIDLFAERVISPNGDKFDMGGRIELMYGGDARFIHSNGLFDWNAGTYAPYRVQGADEQFDPVQAYLTLNVPVGQGLLVTLGKFVTLLGYETINPNSNPLYSHSYLFGFAIPFTHTGILAKYQLTKEWSVQAGIVRGWDQALEDNNDYPSYMAQIAYSKDQLDFYFNAITGPEQTDNNSNYRTVLDAIVVYRYSDQLTFAVNADFGWEPDAGTPSASGTHPRDAIWYGGAVYATYKFDDHFTFAARAEYFNDDKGARGIFTEVTELTAGLNIHPCPENQWLAGLIIRPEVRYDWASDPIFAFDPTDGSTESSQITVGIDAIYNF